MAPSREQQLRIRIAEFFVRNRDDTLGRSDFAVKFGVRHTTVMTIVNAMVADGSLAVHREKAGDGVTFIYTAGPRL